MSPQPLNESVTKAWHDRTRAGLTAASELIHNECAYCEFGTVVVIDLDRFSQLIVRVGVRSGQVLLDNIELALAHATTDLGSSVALGGDQFLVVVPGRCFVNIAPLLLSTVSAARVFRRGWPRCVTASAGVASWPTHGETCGAAVAAAARALEIAKAAGGNRWAVAVDPSSPAHC